MSVDMIEIQYVSEMSVSLYFAEHSNTDGIDGPYSRAVATQHVEWIPWFIRVIVLTLTVNICMIDCVYACHVDCLQE